jgi:hypothetical protein
MTSSTSDFILDGKKLTKKLSIMEMLRHKPQKNNQTIGLQTFLAMKYPKEPLRKVFSSKMNNRNLRIILRSESKSLFQSKKL